MIILDSYKEYSELMYRELDYDWIYTSISYNNDYKIPNRLGLKLISTINARYVDHYETVIHSHLVNLGRDYIDIMLVESLGDIEETTHMFNLVSQDKRFRSIGVTGMSLDELKYFNSYGSISYVLLDVSSTNLDLDYINYCRDNGIKMISKDTKWNDLNLVYSLLTAMTYSPESKDDWESITKYEFTKVPIDSLRSVINNEPKDIEYTKVTKIYDVSPGELKLARTLPKFPYSKDYEVMFRYLEGKIVKAEWTTKKRKKYITIYENRDNSTLKSRINVDISIIKRTLNRN